ncbi:hypothetical protein GCM10010082_24190 [Kushneria pakistanensis]|uniref:Uncharacterized protein n=1 Tax=Kushneria pakistanensis TaxID=1508770 RepID=A0ABQ3FM71_9GAMM|nr:hypothetical protein GCM10010082_24190 [Kushneria pakistanensis]
MPVMVLAPGGHIVASIRCQRITADQHKDGQQYDQYENGNFTEGVMSMMAHGDLPSHGPETATSG